MKTKNIINKIMLFIILLIILGIIWLLNTNIQKEGMTSEENKVVMQKFAKGLVNTIETEFNQAGREINGGKTFADMKNAIPDLFDNLKSLFKYEEEYEYDMSFNSDINSVSDTSAYKPCNEQSFLSGKKFGDSLTEKYRNNPVELNEKCGILTQENCNETSSCIWIGSGKTGQKPRCVAGNEDGPFIKTDSNGNDIDYAYYTYRNDCYGSCGSGTNYANPCSMFKDEQAGVSFNCLNRLWSQTGCPNSRYISSARVEELKDYSKERIKAIFKEAKKEVNYANCYGPNERDWPPECSEYPNNESTNLSVRCLNKLYEDSGCDNNAAIVTPEFASVNKFKTKGEMINEFINYRNGVNDAGIADTSYNKCFGDDTTGWPLPCDGTTDNSTALSGRCMKMLFEEAGCFVQKNGGLFQSTPTFVGDNKNKTKKDMQQMFKTIFSNVDDTSYTQCYGLDRTIWPKRRMLLGITTDYKIMVKSLEKSDSLINGAWSESKAPGQRTMLSITQVTNRELLGDDMTYCFVGIGTDFLMYGKKQLNDVWTQLKWVDKNPSRYTGYFNRYQWFNVKQLNDPNKSLMFINRYYDAPFIMATPTGDATTGGAASGVIGAAVASIRGAVSNSANADDPPLDASFNNTIKLMYRDTYKYHFHDMLYIGSDETSDNYIALEGKAGWWTLHSRNYLSDFNSTPYRGRNGNYIVASLNNNNLGIKTMIMVDNYLVATGSRDNDMYIKNIDGSTTQTTLDSIKNNPWMGGGQVNSQYKFIHLCVIEV